MLQNGQILTDVYGSIFKNANYCIKDAVVANRGQSWYNKKECYRDPSRRRAEGRKKAKNGKRGTI